MKIDFIRFFFLRLNTLYLYEKYGDEYPQNFWLLTNLQELTFLDFQSKSDDEETEGFVLEIAFDCQIIKLRFNTLNSLQKWEKILEKSKNFQAENYFLSLPPQKISHQNIYICVDAKMISTFYYANEGKILKKNWLFQADICDVKMKELKPECTMVVKNDALWRITFSHTQACAKFVKFLDCWSCEGK